jgi:hypothetical protein
MNGENHAKIYLIENKMVSRSAVAKVEKKKGVKNEVNLQ